MSSDQNQYRPRSPDFSAPNNQPGTQHPQPPPRLNRLPSYQIQEPSLPKGYSFSPRGSYDASPFFSPITQQPPPSYFNFPPSTSPQSSAAALPSKSFPPNSGHESSYFQSPQKDFDLPSTNLFGQAAPTNNNSYLSQPFTDFPSQTYDDMARLRQRKTVNYNENLSGPNEFDEHLAPAPAPIGHQSIPYPGLHPSNQAPELIPMAQPQPSQPVSGAMILPKVDVRTKFPVARIKRIMQADEDVGKVAQATPSAVSKALELFMIALVTKGASEAKLQNSKRVTATHLKNALLKDSQFDFLNEVCESAPDEGAKKRGKGEGKESDSDEEVEAKKKSKAKKKKPGSEVDSD